MADTNASVAEMLAVLQRAHKLVEALRPDDGAYKLVLQGLIALQDAYEVVVRAQTECVSSGYEPGPTSA